MKKNLNQKLINLVEYYSLNNINLILSDKPLKRSTNHLSSFNDKTKKQKLDKLTVDMQCIPAATLQNYIRTP